MTVAVAQDRNAEQRAELKAYQEQQLAEALKPLLPEDQAKLLKIRNALLTATRYIDGQETPELVPYHLRMRAFFTAFEPVFKLQLASQLSASDLAILSEYAQRQHNAELRRSAQTFLKEEQNAKAQARHMSAIEIASALKSASDRNEARQSAVFRKVLGRLSAAGQKTVNDFAFAHVRPSFTIFDPIEAAGLAPDVFKEQIVRNYEAEKKGTVMAPPAPVQPMLVPPCEPLAPWSECDPVPEARVISVP